MSENPQPLVSVYLPTRNRARLLKRAVRSVFKQTWKPLELIVTDDASEDETPALLAELSRQHPAMKVLRNPHPKGAAASRNSAIQLAKGSFVAGLDDDDYWFPRRLELLMEAFAGDYAATTSYDRMDFGKKKRTWKKKEVISLQDLLFYNQAGNQVLTKKEYILSAGGYDESLPSAQDYDLWIRLTQKFGPIKTVPHVLQLVNMSDHGDRISTSGNRLSGYKACYEKHRHLMNNPQKTYQQYRMKLASGKRVSFSEMLRSVPFRLLAREIARRWYM